MRAMTFSSLHPVQLLCATALSLSLAGCGGGETTSADSAVTTAGTRTTATRLATEENASGTGLNAEYFYNSDFTGTSIRRVDASVDFDWERTEPVPDTGDKFAVRWTGQVEARYSETYTFHTLSDDGIRVSIDGKKIIDNWGMHAVTENAGQIALVAGKKYDVLIEYFDGGGHAVAKFAWSSPSQARQAVPKESLYPSVASGVAASSVAILNPGFEAGVTQDWSSHAASVEKTIVKTGANAARVSGEPEWWWGGIYRTVVGLEPNTKYVLETYARKGSGSPGLIYVKNYGGPDISSTVSSTEYTLHSLAFTTGADRTSVEFGASIDSGNAADHFFVDDFKIRRESQSSTVYQPLNTLDNVINDLILPTDDAKPHGVPTSYAWYNPVRYKAFSTRTTNYPLATSPSHTWTAFTGWGQLYEAADANGARLNSATNSRVQLKDMRTFYLSKKDSKWHLLQASRNVEGGAYREDFAGDVSVTPNLRNEADGSISVVPGGGYNFHFWPGGRGEFADPSDVAAVFVTVKARLTTDDAAKASDFDRASYVMNLGGDIWYDMDAKWDQWKTNGDVGMGRFKRITPAWQSFNVYAITSMWDHTLTPAFIRSNPPVLE